jgi:hypothetical protein
MVELEAVDAHAEAAELGVNVGATGQRLDVPLPADENLVPLVRVPAEPQRSPDMVEHDRLFGERAGQIDQVAELRMIQPCIER